MRQGSGAAAEAPCLFQFLLLFGAWFTPTRSGRSRPLGRSRYVPWTLMIAAVPSPTSVIVPRLCTCFGGEWHSLLAAGPWGGNTTHFSECLGLGVLQLTGSLAPTEGEGPEPATQLQAPRREAQTHRGAPLRSSRQPPCPPGRAQRGSRLPPDCEFPPWTAGPGPGAARLASKSMVLPGGLCALIDRIKILGSGLLLGGGAWHLHPFPQCSRLASRGRPCGAAACGLGALGPWETPALSRNLSSPRLPPWASL